MADRGLVCCVQVQHFLTQVFLLLLLESGGYIYVFMKWKLYFGVYRLDFIGVLHHLYMKNEMN